MSNKFQRGFVPPIVIILLTIIGISGILIIKNISTDKSQPANQAFNITKTKTTPTPIVSQTKSKSLTPAPTQKTPTTSQNTTPTPTSSSNNNSNPTNTPIPTVTSTSAPTPTQSATNYSVKLTYPNGGEAIKIGDTIHITWEATGAFSTFILSGTTIYNGTETGFNIGSTTNSNARSMDWVVDIGNAITPRQAKFFIIANKWPRFVGDSEATQKTDSSDEYFTITR